MQQGGSRHDAEDQGKAVADVERGDQQRAKAKDRDRSPVQPCVQRDQEQRHAEEKRADITGRADQERIAAAGRGQPALVRRQGQALDAAAGDHGGKTMRELVKEHDHHAQRVEDGRGPEREGPPGP